MGYLLVYNNSEPTVFPMAGTSSACSTSCGFSRHAWTKRPRVGALRGSYGELGQGHPGFRPKKSSEWPGDDIDIRMTNLGNQILNGIFQNVCRGHTQQAASFTPLRFFVCLEIKIAFALSTRMQQKCGVHLEKVGIDPARNKGLNPSARQACLRTTN